MTKVNAETVYTGDGRYVDIDTDTNKVLAFFLRGTGYYAATDSVYTGDSESGFYIVTTTSGMQFKITVTEDGEGETKTKTATIENYEEPQEEETDQQ